MDTQAQTSSLMKPAARQQILLHAVVGSLVLCAVLAHTEAQASVLPAPEQCAAQAKGCDQLAPDAKAQTLSRSHVAQDFPRTTSRDQVVHVILNNMIVSANGKQLFSLLGMSRERAGNLLRQNLSNP